MSCTPSLFHQVPSTSLSLLHFFFLLPCRLETAQDSCIKVKNNIKVYNNISILNTLTTSHAVLPPCLSPPIHLCLALSLCLAFSPSCYEGHQASGDAVPQEESKLASPSLLLFFHNLLFMSDRPPPDKWLPYGERKAEEKEGRKNSLCILFLPVAS